MKFAFVVLALALAAQAQEPVFDVVSVKPSQSTREGSSIHNNPGRFETSGTTLYQLIVFALGVEDFQVSGGPAWIKDDRFDITATNERAETAPVNPSDMKGNADRVARIRARVRHLLEDRFQLQLREEQREVPVYALSIEKSGLKLKVAPEPVGNVNTNQGAGGGSISGKGLTMDRFCQVLSGLVERPVTDETGVEGAYDVELKYSLDLAAPVGGTAAKDSSQASPPLFTAIKEQLGLRLTGKKGMTRTWVVVRAEKPSEN